MSEATRQRAAALAAQSGSSIVDVVDRALDAYETAEFWRRTRAALARHSDALEVDPAWERSSHDGLDSD